MKTTQRTTPAFLAATLFSTSVAWAAEPPQAPTNSNEGTTVAPAAVMPVPAEPAAEGSSAPPPPPAPVAPAPLAAPSAPNSVEASPYGTGGSETPAPVAAPPPAPAPQSDAPATLFASGADVSVGGFGGIGVMYTRFAGNDRPLVCGEGAVIIDHRFTLGGGGCGIAAVMDGEKYGNAPHSDRDRMSFGYGGAIIRYHFFSRNAVNLAIGGLVGAGGLELATWNGTGNESNMSENYNEKSQDAVFVVEPQIGGYANLTRWLRVGAVGGYRVVSGVDTKGLRAADLRGPTIGGQIQAGWF